MTIRERLASIPQEEYERIKKQMTCAYYFNGGDCSKGLPGTPCELKGCVAWRLADWAKEKGITL